MPSEWWVCQTDASVPFVVNAVFLVLYTESWPTYRNVWPLKICRNIGKTVSICFDEILCAYIRPLFQLTIQQKACLFFTRLTFFVAKPILHGSNTWSGEYWGFFTLTFCTSCSHFYKSFQMLLLAMCHLYSICASCHCCHSYWLTMKLRIKTFLFQWKCILRLFICHLLIGIFSITCNTQFLFLSLLVAWYRQVARYCSRMVFLQCSQW